ncbi:MAG: hypothetical protein KF802_11210 [Bdellovibrionaceae bacterium]|nr:hypothetical protein [Pseudobdellovibrionaceae bacterium]MBX3032685.1 hypothetical protein [Pseudobdellovibrionaceae bacterium]
MMKVFFLFSALLLPLSAVQARVKLSQTKPVVFPQTDVKLSVNSDDVRKVIPMDMKATNDAGAVAQRVGDRALQNWLESPAVKNSSFGRTATHVEGAMKTEMSLQGGDDKKTEHKIAFQVQALQATTKLQYKGWVNAEANYDARAKASSVQLTEKMMDNKNVVLSHTANSREGVSSLGVSWSW